MRHQIDKVKLLRLLVQQQLERNIPKHRRQVQIPARLLYLRQHRRTHVSRRV
jgi:hypothetical protein